MTFRSTAETFVRSRLFNSQTYFRDIIGTMKTGQEPQVVVLHFSPERGKYVETKKLHPLRQANWLASGRLEVRLRLELNREREARISEFGKDVLVVSPATLQVRIKVLLAEVLSQYQ